LFLAAGAGGQQEELQGELGVEVLLRWGDRVAAAAAAAFAAAAATVA
jgi:hypothetical protein